MIIMVTSALAIGLAKIIAQGGMIAFFCRKEIGQIRDYWRARKDEIADNHYQN